MEKVKEGTQDWDCRWPMSPPGLVWSISSDTCGTGPPEAPDNVLFTDLGQEFVFRQPRNERELIEVMNADVNEVFDCYRFDGLDRWSFAAAQTWWETVPVLEGWLEHRLVTESDAELNEHARVHLDYLRSEEFKEHMIGVLAYL